MDKLINASNASNTDSSFKDGEYVFYVIKELGDKTGYVLRFIGESPKARQKISVALSMCVHYRKLDDSSSNSREIDKCSPERILDDLHEYEEPGHCVIRNGILYIRRLHSVKSLVKKRVMMVSNIPEFVMEDMSTYKLPKWSNSNDAGSAGWLMEKYINKPEVCTVLNALIFNDVLVDIEWSRDIPTQHNLLDRLQYFIQNIGWTAEEIINYLGTGNIKTED